MIGRPAPGLLDAAEKFSERVTTYLGECLPNSVPMVLTATGSKAEIKPHGQTDRQGGIPLSADGETLAWLRLDFLCRLDATSEHLAIDRSKIWVVASVDATPLFRFEYLYEAGRVPHSHIHVHGERGALAHLLSRTKRSKPHNMSTLHLPTGGARFRPNLEDVVQFLITDCKFDSLPTWGDAVDRERAEWRRIQTRAACRALPEEAAGVLRKLGYRVAEPEGGPPDPGRKALGSW